MHQEIVIEKIRRRGSAFILYLSDGRKISMQAEALAKYNLGRGEAIDEKYLERIKNESDLIKAMDYCLYLLSRRAYSTGMLRKKMGERGYQAGVVGKVLSDLKNRGLLDDRVYAIQSAEALMRRKPAGKRFLIAYLRTKLIPRQLANEIAAECYQDVDETEMADRLLRARWRYLSKFDLETARTKAYNYLSRRSIDYRTAKAAFERLLREEN